MDDLVTTSWLEDNLGAADLVVADATWFLPNEGRDARTEFETAHIAGALFLDLPTIADPENPLPMTLPSAAQFAAQMAERGIGDTQRIVLYDNSSFGSAARAWWMLSRVFEASQVAILDGGFAKWAREGRAVEAGVKAPPPASFAAVENRNVVRSKADMLANIGSAEAQVIDARGPGRFSGDDPEPRPGMASGHIPGSINLPYAKLYTAEGTWNQGDELRAAFEQAGIDLSKPIVATCGSGMSAAVLAFGAHLLGCDDVAIYDGSWSEWGADPATPKATGHV
jgi:thiosulfate/3-mercaptopyruvate sulfurtransferase